MDATNTLSVAQSPRERILAAAHDLFYGEGIRATGIDKIIEASKVTKVTFYRQFASKDELIRAYLAYRHERWMAWFRASLDIRIAEGSSPTCTLLSTLEEWFSRSDFRGCAFLNSTAELGTSAPDILATVRAHKAEMASACECLLPDTASREAKARALAIAVDGAILQAQMGIPLPTVMEGLKALVQTLLTDERIEPAGGDHKQPMPKVQRRRPAGHVVEPIDDASAAAYSAGTRARMRRSAGAGGRK